MITSSVVHTPMIRAMKVQYTVIIVIHASHPNLSFHNNVPNNTRSSVAVAVPINSPLCSFAISSTFVVIALHVIFRVASFEMN